MEPILLLSLSALITPTYHYFIKNTVCVNEYSSIKKKLMCSYIGFCVSSISLSSASLIFLLRDPSGTVHLVTFLQSSSFLHMVPATIHISHTWKPVLYGHETVNNRIYVQKQIPFSIYFSWTDFYQPRCPFTAHGYSSGQPVPGFVSPGGIIDQGRC